jgi:hypothetical protein
MLHVDCLHRKKKVREFPVPSRDVTTCTKLSLGGNNDVITELFLPSGSLVSDIPAGDGKLVNLFLRCGQAASEISKLYFSHIYEVARNLSIAQGNQNKKVTRRKKPPTALQEEIYAHCTVFLIFKIFNLKGVPEKGALIVFEQYLEPVWSFCMYFIQTLFQLPLLRFHCIEGCLD